MEQQSDKEVSEKREQSNYVDPVSRGIRFVNYIVDYVAIGVIINGVKFCIAYYLLGESFRDHIFIIR